MKKMFRILRTIIKLTIWLFCILLVAIILIQRFSNNQFTFLGFRIFNVATESMVPKYKVGDILIIKTIEPNEIKVGDDITYIGEVGSFKDRIVTHQVIKIEEKNREKIFHTKGIANETEDPTIKGQQIYGKVLYKFILISYFSNIVNNMYGIYILLTSSVVVVIIMEIIDYRKMKQEENTDELDNEENSIKSRKKGLSNRMRAKRRKKQEKQQKKE